MTRSRRLWLSRWHTRVRYARSSGAVRRWALYSIGILVVGWVTWVLVTGLFARRDAVEVRDRLARAEAQVAQGDLAGARRTAAAIPTLTDHAHRLTSGPAWWAAAELPYVGRPFEIARDLTAVTSDFGRRGVPALLAVADELNPDKLRTAPNTVNLRPLQAAAPKLQVAATALDAALTRLKHGPRSSWLPAFDQLRGSVAATLGSVSGYVDAAARTAAVLPRFLGDGAPRRYFVGLQNEAEMRGTGGLPGAFAIVVATDGQVHFTHFESDDALLPADHGSQVRTGLSFGADYQKLYGASGPTELFPNSNLSPNFPYAAQIWARMWTVRTGERIDGAIAVDPQVLANFLSATGPVRTPEGPTLTAQNVVSLTERDEYSLFTDQADRKQFLTDSLRVVANRILNSSTPPSALVRAMSLSSRERRVLVWVRDPVVERLIAQTHYSGIIPDSRSPFVGMIVNNLVGGKLDYYLRRSVSYQRVGCGSSRDMVVTMTLANDAPASGLPPVVTGRLDQRAAPIDTSIRPGDNRSLLDYYASAGAELTSVTINGVPATAGVSQDRGHPVYRFDLELPRGRSEQIVLHLTEPGGPGSVNVWQQPGVTPIQVDGFTQSCP